MVDLTDSVTATPPPAPLPLPLPPPPSSQPSRPPPVREDCWTEEATATLIDSWGRRYLELNRGNLRQKDWQEVADAVNALHGLTKKTHRTDVQCKNRVDTVKKKYKVEKQKVLSSPDGSYVSDWVFFDRMDFLIGNKNLNFRKPVAVSSPASPPLALPLPYKRMSPSHASSAPATAKVVALPQKRGVAVSDDGYFRRNYSAMAAAAAAAEAEDDDVEDEDEDGGGSESDEGVERGEGDGEKEKGFRRLVKAIERFGKLYERIEVEKLRHSVELEKQRMQFEKEMEVQRMQMFMDTQVQIERIKRRKKTSSSGGNGMY